MRKKLATLLLTASLGISTLAACGGETATSQPAATKAATTAVATSAATTVAGTTAATGTTKAATTAAATTAPATSAAAADNSQAVAALKSLESNLTATTAALKKGDIDAAKTAFKQFDNAWYGVEESVRLASRETYRDLEDSIAKAGRSLLRTEKPVAEEVLPQIQALQTKYAEGIKKVETSKPVVTQKLPPISGKDVDTANAKVSTYLKGKSDELVKTTGAFVEAVKSRSIEKAKAAYEVARFDYESVEFLAEAFSEFDIAIDARPDDFEQGENDPKWTGYHPLEKAIFKDGKLDERTDKLADQLLKDVTDLNTEIKKLDIDAAVAIAGAGELIEEIQAGKITGEEERYSHTDLNDFRANFQSAKLVYEAYSPFLRQRNSTLDDDLKARFSVVEKSIEPYFDAQGKAASYSKVDDPTRKDLAQKVEALADMYSRVSGTLGLKI